MGLYIFCKISKSKRVVDIPNSLNSDPIEYSIVQNYTFALSILTCTNLTQLDMNLKNPSRIYHWSEKTISRLRLCTVIQYYI